MSNSQAFFLVVLLTWASVGSFHLPQPGKHKRLLFGSKSNELKAHQTTPHSTLTATNSTSASFIRTFPRYSIDLTREKDILHDLRLSKQQRTFQWPWEQDNLSLATNDNRISDGTATSILSYPQVATPVDTVKILWQTMADMQNGKGKRASIVLLPNAPVKAQKQWTDMVTWMNEQGLTNITATFGSQPTQTSTTKGGFQIVITAPNEVGVERPTRGHDIPDHSTITKRTQAWVRRVLVEMGICPFTKSVKRSGHGVPGVPVADIAYHTSIQTTLPGLLADAWTAMADMLEAGPSRVSSILLAAPAWDSEFDLWAGPLFALLETSVVVAEATDQLGVVCFHPLYQTPDGTSWPGFGHMHSVPRLQSWCSEHAWTAEQVAEGGAWQRRTPHATINVLRAEQLAAAEGKRSTAELYADNIGKLLRISDSLPVMLERERSIE